MEEEKKEKGYIFVEAVLVFPVCILMVLALYYAAIFMCQKANLQANLQTALVYYSSQYDPYVGIDDQMNYSLQGGTQEVTASSYEVSGALFPYRFFGMEFSGSQFESFFDSMSGYMFFDDGSNITVEAKSENYVIYRKITAQATQVVRPAVSFSLLGLDDSMTISAGGQIVISDQDELIRNVDMVIDIVSQTEFGQKVSELIGKCTDLYNEFKEKFGV